MRPLSENLKQYRKQIRNNLLLIIMYNQYEIFFINYNGGGVTMKWLISTILGFACSTILFLFGEIDVNLKYLIAVVILDYITGLCRAIIKKKVNSSIGVKGIFKKFCYFVIVALAVILGNILDVGYSIRNLTIYSLIFNECISIVENCIQMGMKMPSIISSSLEVFNNKLINDEENIKDDNKKTKD